MSAVAPESRRRTEAGLRTRLRRFLTSSIGLKIIMAVTGVILSGFVLGHMLGNLQVFQGAEAIDAYGQAAPRRSPPCSGPSASGCSPRSALHIWAYLALTRQNRAARPEGYRAAAVPGVELRLAVDDADRAAPARVHRLPPPPPDDRHRPLRASRRATSTTTWSRACGGAGRRSSTSWPWSALAFHLWHGVWSMFQTLGRRPGRGTARSAGGSRRPSPCRGDAGVRRRPPGRPGRAPQVIRSVAVELNVERPARPDRAEVDQAQVRHEAGQPGEQAEVLRDRRRHRAWPARSAAATLAELGYKVAVLLLPGQPAAGALHRRPGRHQRGQELPERRRQRLPALLRHHQGRRLPRPRGQRLPPRRGVGQHHRPVRRPGRALRPRVRRHCSPTAPSAAPRSRAPSTPAARPASSSCSGAYQALERQIGLGTVKMYTAARDAGAGRGRRPGPRHRHPRPGDRRRSSRTPPTRSCWPPAATATSSTWPPTPRAATSRPSGAPTRRARRSPTPATRRSTRPASPSPASTRPS